MELPQYRCHKVVRAARILRIDTHPTMGGLGRLLLEWPDGTTVPWLVPPSYAAKHDPQVGGYFVVYEDRYESFSPAAAFEAGYTLLTDAE
jgi:hypothetical protein